VTIKCVTQQILFSLFGGRKAPSGIGKISTAGVLRLRATSAVSRDKSVRRSAQDDNFVGIMTKNILSKLALLGLRPGLLSARPYWTQSGESGFHADSKALTILAGGGTTKVVP
jgi:hypothetical protein